MLMIWFYLHNVFVADYSTYSGKIGNVRCFGFEAVEGGGCFSNVSDRRDIIGCGFFF